NIALDLINSKRILIQEGDCVLNYEYDQVNDRLAKLFLFDNLILVCWKKLDIKDSLLRILEVIQLVTAKFEYDQKNVWIKIQTQKKLVVLKFDLHKIRNLWFKKFTETQQLLAKESVINIEEIIVPFNKEYEFESIANVNFKKFEVKDQKYIYDRFNSEINKAGLFFQPENIFSFWNVLGEKTGIGEKNIELSVSNAPCIEKDILLFSTKEKMYLKIGNDEITIYNKSANKIYYDHENFLIIFISNREIFVDVFSTIKYPLNPILIQKNVTNFFVYYLRDLKFLAIVYDADEYYSEILIYNISTQKNKTYLSFIRKAFVGIDIKHIFGIDDMTIVVSEDTKIVNMYTLEIWPFLNPFNYILTYHLHCVDNKNPSFVWQIDYDTIMLCFSSFAIYTDRNGNTKSDINILLWQFEAINFNTAKNMLIVSGDTEYAIIKDKKVLRYKRSRFFKIAILNNEIYVFEKYSVYKVMINDN
ncbi:hypothetical protein H311_02631, partial [Anncaliia algerae PRA109]